jgi:WS/DGAT/MGAT family acyltransferase
MDGGQVVALLLGCLFDSTPEGRTVPPPGKAWVPDREPSLAWFAADTARSLATRPLHAIRAIGDAVKTIIQPAPVQRGSRGKSASLFEAPATMFNGALTPHRSVAFADVAFGDLKTIKRAFDTTINDVVLAACCDAVRSWLLARGGLPDGPLVVNVPVTVRSDGEEDTGNRVSMILVHLPVEIDDPVERLMAIRADTRRAKAEHDQAGGDVLQQFSSVLTNITVPWLLTHVMELYSSAHVADRLPFPWNLVVSNLPGPTVPLYCGAARVLRVYPLGPVQQGSGLNITVLSTMDRMCFGAMACRELVPDVEELATGFVHATEALRKLAEQRT